VDGAALVLFHRETGVVFTANHVAARIWQSLAEGESLDAIAEALSRDYHIAAAVAAQDVAQFVRELAAHALIDGEAAS
jgi:PqqD family protein of HPr-rel-A system